MLDNIQKQQNLQELVINASADTYRSRGMTTHVNLENEKQKSIGDCYPDVIAERDNKQIIIESIETGDTINDLECYAKWIPYSRLGHQFIIIVPKGLSVKTRDILRKHKIQAYIQQYTVDDSGQVTFYDNFGNTI